MTEHRQYSSAMLAGMQAAYGEGFLSPGAAGDVRRLMAPLDVAGKRVLDLGCGVGGATLMFASEFNARAVTAADLEPAALAQTSSRVTTAGLSDRVVVKLLDPGPLPFPDGAFDLVYSKDVICHVADKTALFSEVHRVLEHDGFALLGDWMPHTLDAGDGFNAWSDALAAGGLKFFFEPCRAYEDALHRSGFENVQTDDVSAVFLQSAETELSQLRRDASLSDVLGEEGAARRISMTQARLDALAAGELTYSHIRAGKRETV